jgi:phospholipid/cholesterol/gamma-HCH transport system substrate-binding protein
LETKANYVLVGIFTMAVLLASFGFVYWIARGTNGSETATLEIRIPGSVTGLTVGSLVLFNGIKYGDVRKLAIDPDNPSTVVVTAEVDKSAPITPQTKATLGFQGLTGQAYIELQGGDPNGVNILEAALAAGGTAKIDAGPGAVNNLIDKAQQISVRAENILSKLDEFISLNEAPLTQTVANAQKFSDSLAKNSENIDKFLVTVGELSKTLGAVSGKLDSTLTAAEDLLKSVDRAKVDKVLANAEKVSDDLAKSSGRVESLVSGVEGSVKNFGAFTESASKTISGVEKLVSSADAAKVAAAIDNIEAASKTARTALDDFAKISAKIGGRGEDIDRIIGNAAKISEDFAKSSDKIDTLVASLQDSMKNIGGFTGTAKTTLENVDKLVAAASPDKVRSTLDNIESASKTAKTALDGIAKVSDTVGARGKDIDQIISNVKDLSGRLNQTGVRLDGVLAKVDGFLGDGGVNGKGLGEEARVTLVAFRKVADTLNSRLGEITDGLARFSGRGLKDVESAVQDSRRSIARIESAISSLERNPSRLIFGGTDSVPRTDGRNRR